MLTQTFSDEFVSGSRSKHAYFDVEKSDVLSGNCMDSNR